MIGSFIVFATELMLIAGSNWFYRNNAAPHLFVLFLICEVSALFCIAFNVKRIPQYKGVAITGLIFSVISTMIGMLYIVILSASL